MPRSVQPPRVLNIEDLRGAARRRLPRVVFDYIDGGAEAELTLRANCRAFEAVTFQPRCAVATPACDLRTTVLGTPLSIPLILAFSIIVGARFCFEIPLTLQANWIFQVLARSGHHRNTLHCPQAASVPLALLACSIHVRIFTLSLGTLHRRRAHLCPDLLFHPHRRNFHSEPAKNTIHLQLSAVSDPFSSNRHRLSLRFHYSRQLPS